MHLCLERLNILQEHQLEFKCLMTLVSTMYLIVV